MYRNAPDRTVAEIGRDYAAIHPEKTYQGSRQKLVRLLEAQGIKSVPESAHPDWNTPPVIEGDALIMGDLHLPYHDAAHVNRCIAAAHKLGVTKLILAGDALDMRAFSHWPDDFSDNERMLASNNVTQEILKLAGELDAATAERLYQLADKIQPENGNIGEEIRTSREFFKILDDNFGEVVYIMGNHEAWVIRAIEKTIASADFARLFVGETRWKVSPYYWCKLISGGVEWQIEHPKNSGKGSSKKLSPVFLCNIVMLHNHHYSVQSDPSGTWLAIEPGMCADEKKIQYDNQRHGTHDRHITGSVIIKDGKAHLLNKFTDWSLYL